MEISKKEYEICRKKENSRLDKFSTFGLRWHEPINPKFHLNPK